MPRHIESVKRHNLALNPRLGSYVISRVDVPPEASQSLSSNIRVLSVGYDMHKMEPVVDALIEARKWRKRLG